MPLTARSESIRHGGFDNDVATMTSVVRRVLDVSDTTAVVDYFEETIPGFERAPIGAVRPVRAEPVSRSNKTRRRVRQPTKPRRTRAK